MTVRSDLDVTARDYLADPQSVPNPAGGDESLGFGADFALITPYLLAVADG